MALTHLVAAAVSHLPVWLLLHASSSSSPINTSVILLQTLCHRVPHNHTPHLVSSIISTATVHNEDEPLHYRYRLLYYFHRYATPEHVLHRHDTDLTGVSFCEVTGADLKSQDVEVIHDWPSRFTRIGTREKVPSEISYQAEGLAWGASIAPDVPRHMWTKLQLDSAAGGEAAKIQQESARFDKSKQKEPVQIIADFLAQVKIHLMKNLDQKYGKTLWRSLPIYLVVTVPAVWSDLAKARTLQAVDRAGFNSQGTEFPKLEKTVIATEPEAAAIYTINSMRQSVYDNNLKVGDGFIMCDMGGGTVDLISYKVAKLEPTWVEEITVGSGNQCGGSFVDRTFLQWLERRLGTPDFIEIAGCRSEQVPRINLNRKAARMLQDFIQEIKCGFDGTQTNSLRLPKPLKDLEDDEERGIEDGELGVTA